MENWKHFPSNGLGLTFKGGLLQKKRQRSRESLHVIDALDRCLFYHTLSHFQAAASANKNLQIFIAEIISSNSIPGLFYKSFHKHLCSNSRFTPNKQLRYLSLFYSHPNLRTTTRLQPHPSDTFWWLCPFTYKAKGQISISSYNSFHQLLTSDFSLTLLNRKLWASSRYLLHVAPSRCFVWVFFLQPTLQI